METWLVEILGVGIVGTWHSLYGATQHAERIRGIHRGVEVAITEEQSMMIFPNATTAELIQYDIKVSREIKSCEPSSLAARDWLRTRKLIRGEINRRHEANQG